MLQDTTLQLFRERLNPEFRAMYDEVEQVARNLVETNNMNTEQHSDDDIVLSFMLSSAHAVIQANPWMKEHATPPP